MSYQLCTTTQKCLVHCPILNDRFFEHHVPEVRHYLENVLRIAPEEGKALILLDNAPAHPDADKLVSADGKVLMFILPNTTLIMQPMDLGEIVSCKRPYQRCYLDEVLAVRRFGIRYKRPANS